MRLGGNVFYTGTDPEEYALAHVKKGFGAALCPDWISLERPDELRHFQEAMKKHDVKIAEVGAWCNVLHPDKKQAEENIQHVINRLRLAEELRASTCVNIIGTKQTETWFGPHKDCYSEEFIKEAVNVSQYIIDSVKPEYTKLSFEMMPYCFLDSPQAYTKFLETVNRNAAGVHLDICNTMNQPKRYFENSEFIKETFRILSKDIVTLHLKDIRLKEDSLTVAFDEVLIGTGGIDYDTLLKEIAKLPEDTPAMLEHLDTEQEYDLAAEAVVNFAKNAGMQKKGLVWTN